MQQIGLVSQSVGHLIEDKRGDILCRGLDLDKWRDVVEKRVIQAFNDTRRGFFQLSEINDHSSCTRPIRACDNMDPVVVTVKSFALSLVFAQAMCG